MDAITLRIFRYVISVAIIFQSLSCSEDDGDSSPTETISDIEGNVYQTVKIGQQTWMAENLKVTKYRNGDAIGTTSAPDQDIFSEVAPAYQWPYNGIMSNADKYGRLYTVSAMSDSRGVCPNGWHVPTDDEWTEVVDFLGGASNAQKLLIEKGFKPQYGGYRLSYFNDLDYYGVWWSTSAVPDSEPGAVDQNYVMIMVKGANNTFRSYHHKSTGMSIRCVKD
jgi:uncharacterized protein (TIGR02145 family)